MLQRSAGQAVIIMQLTCTIMHQHAASNAHHPRSMTELCTQDRPATVPPLFCTAQVPRSSDAGTHRSRTQRSINVAGRSLQLIRLTAGPALVFQCSTLHFTADRHLQCARQ